MLPMSRCVSLLALALSLGGCPAPAAQPPAPSTVGAEQATSTEDPGTRAASDDAASASDDAGPPSDDEAPASDAEAPASDETPRDTPAEPDDPSVTREGDRLLLATPIAFAIERDRILPESQPQLEALAAHLARHTEITCLEIGGHTDDRGVEARPLGQARAESVRDYLVMRGIESERLRPVGYGATQPLVPGTSERARRANRRIELRVCDAAAPR